MSKPAFICLSLRSFLGSSLTAQAKERLRQHLEHCPRQPGFAVPGTSWCRVFLEGKERGEVRGASCAVNKSLHPIVASSSYSTQIFPALSCSPCRCQTSHDRAGVLAHGKLC